MGHKRDYGPLTIEVGLGEVGTLVTDGKATTTSGINIEVATRDRIRLVTPTGFVVSTNHHGYC